MEIDPILLIASLLAANLIGVTTAGMFFERANKDKPLKDSVEHMLFNSVPKDLLVGANKVFHLAGEVVKFGEAVTNGEPNEVEE